MTTISAKIVAFSVALLFPAACRGAQLTKAQLAEWRYAWTCDADNCDPRARAYGLRFDFTTNVKLNEVDPAHLLQRRVQQGAESDDEEILGGKYARGVVTFTHFTRQPPAR